jgi:hypothetical protein
MFNDRKFRNVATQKSGMSPLRQKSRESCDTKVRKTWSVYDRKFGNALVLRQKSQECLDFATESSGTQIKNLNCSTNICNVNNIKNDQIFVWSFSYALIQLKHPIAEE